MPQPVTPQPVTPRQRETLTALLDRLQQLDQARDQVLHQLQMVAYLALEEAPEGWELNLGTMTLEPVEREVEE